MLDSGPVMMTDHQTSLVLSSVAGSVSLVVAILGALAAYLAAKRQQRRLTYSEAVRAATAWKELLYRVRRRQAGQGRESAIIDLFHQAQGDLSYYQAWVGAESKYMARSYERLVKAVKEATEAPIQQAWQDNIRPIPSEARQGDVHPDLSESVGAFLQDVRSHLSPWPWRKIAMVRRNRKDA